MKFLKKFEGRGISNIIKEYTDIIYNYYQGDNKKVQFDFDYIELPLIDLRIEFKSSNKYYAYYDPTYSKFIDKKLHDITIYIEIDKNNLTHHKIKGIISHELTHIKEFYEIFKKMDELKIDIQPTYIKIRNIVSILDDNLKDFIYLVYLSYDTEMNARISQVYHYLYDFNIQDKGVLFQKLQEHENWNYLVLLQNFNHKEFVDDTINKIQLNGLLKITNELINKFKDKQLNKNTILLKFIDKNVNNIDELYHFYSQWGNYFKIKSKKHLDKFNYLIDEVIEDLKGNRPYNQSFRNALKEQKIFNDNN